MVKIYTKTGDQGTTSLFGGRRVAKHSMRIKCVGYVDELNALLGIALLDSPAPITKNLLRVQAELFVLGADLATPLEVKVKVPRVARSFTTRLEREIDEWEKKLPKLTNFILPGGSSSGSRLHLARATARRAERAIVALSGEEKINGAVLPYINRLSDWFFVVARYANKLDDATEQVWAGRSKT
ncbi:MAG: cob(I)yrinic acid a,c-diamide adenosyltransferase [Candidatus Curtissbacteria bacterium]